MEFPFRIDEKLKHKFNLLAKQLDKKDVWILVTGDEGSGKTNTATYILYYFHCLLGRDFKIEQFYFDVEDLFNFGKANKEKLLNWDEAALGGLSTEWWSQAQINLIKLAIVGRKKHHVFIMCIPRFDKLKEELRQDRIHAQIHMDCGTTNDKYGHYIYLTRRGIKYLNRLWKMKKIRCYGKAMRKCGGFAGDLPYVFDKVFTKQQQAYYEQKKDDAIANIGNKKNDKSLNELRRLECAISNIAFPIKTKAEFAGKIGVNIRTMQRWQKDKVKWGIIGTPLKSDSDTATEYNNNGLEPEQESAANE